MQGVQPVWPGARGCTVAVEPARTRSAHEPPLALLSSRPSSMNAAMHGAVVEVIAVPAVLARTNTAERNGREHQ